MAVFPGFGVNYKATQANWSADIAYFKSIGLNCIRPNMAQLPIPWSAGTPNPTGSAADVNAYWRLCAKTFAEAGFWVTWGGTSGSLGSITAANWALYHDSVVAEAMYLQAQGIFLGDFELANESELHVDGTTMTIPQLNANLRQLALDVKAVYTLSPISKGTAISIPSLDDWIANGLGGLDSISIHPYGAAHAATQSVTTGAFGWIATMKNAFGSACYVSEFNLDTSSSNITSLGAGATTAAMRSILDSFIIGKVDRAILYSWVGFLNQDDKYAQLYMNNSMNPMWFEFFNSDPKTYAVHKPTEPRHAYVERLTETSRLASENRDLDV